MAKIPQFASLEEEADFWGTHDSTDYLDDTEPVDVIFVDKRPKGEVSLRFEPDILAQIGQIATAKDMGYNTLMQQWIKERLAAELAAQQAAPGEVVQAAS